MQVVPLREKNVCRIITITILVHFAFLWPSCNHKWLKHTHTDTHPRRHYTPREQMQPRCAKREKRQITKPNKETNRKLIEVKGYLLSLFKKAIQTISKYEIRNISVVIHASVDLHWMGGSTVFAPHVFLYQMANTITARVHSHKPSDLTSSS